MVLGGGIAIGALLMLAQRSVRRYQKRLEDRLPKECPEGSIQGPLPEGRRPLRLLSSVRGYLPHMARSKRGLNVGGSASGGSRGGRGRANSGGGAGVGSAAAVPASSRSPRSAAAAWDLESQASLGQSSLDSLPQSIAATRGLSPAQQALQAQQAQQAQGSPRSLGRPSVLRPTVLQAVDSIYEAGHAGIKWKSMPRQGTHPASPGQG